MADIPSIGPAGGNVTRSDTVTCVMRGLLHELANVATAFDGVTASLRFDGPSAMDRSTAELGLATDRLFTVHAELRSLMPDREGETPLDPRALAADVARLLTWHVDRPATVSLDEGPVAPVLGEPWLLRRQLLEAVDYAMGEATAFRFSFRSGDEAVEAVSSEGAVFWSAPTLAAARRRERDAAG